MVWNRIRVIQTCNSGTPPPKRFTEIPSSQDLGLNRWNVLIQISHCFLHGQIFFLENWLSQSFKFSGHEMFLSPLGWTWFFGWAMACDNFFKVKHRMWIKESTCSIFPHSSPCKVFFSAVFAAQELLLNANCATLLPPLKKIMVHP